jgi:hypothetical protein
MAAVFRLLALVAVLMLPFAMMPVQAAPLPAHDMNSPMPPAHCPGQQDGDDNPAWIGKCAMPCSAALPALDDERLAPEPVVRGGSRSDFPEQARLNPARDSNAASQTRLSFDFQEFELRSFQQCESDCRRERACAR